MPITKKLKALYRKRSKKSVCRKIKSIKKCNSNSKCKYVSKNKRNSYCRKSRNTHTRCSKM